ncbi:MAG: choice-of-anchor D domain-containing protein [Bacteroidetes bacterium]|nr:choice-of-anchor D domain-containing protein [Bacteroidota bacterium]
MSIGVGDFNTDGKQDFITTVSNYQNCAIRLGGANEIDVLGNSVSIADGSTSPLTTNHTDFGVVATNSSLARTYTISNTGNTALTIPTGGITLTGTDASMFVLSGITLPATIAAGGTRTFVVTFTPTSQGAKTVTLNVANNDCDEAPYNFALRGGQVCDFSTCVGKTLTFNATNSGASYAWSFGDAGTSTAQNPSHAYTAPGQYTVTFQLTDVNGCVTTNSQIVCVYDAPVVTNTSLNPLCNGATNGSIDVSVTGGAPGTTFTYVWSNGATTQDLSNVGAGSYTVTVTDGTTTCFSTLSVTLTEPVVLAAAATVGTNVLCFGATTGTATASATGGTTPYTYAWSNGQTVANATGLAAGNFTVTVTDANGCSTTASVTIAQPAAALAATETHTNVGCFGASTGAIDLTVTGGTSAYTYLWSNGATTEDLSGLAAGTYTVTITDANGCSTTASATVGEPASALAVAPSNSGNVCQAGSNSNLLSNATGGTPGYTYLWTPGNVTTQNVNNVGAGTYNVTVTDANGCTATGSTTVGTFPGTPASFIISH